MRDLGDLKKETEKKKSKIFLPTHLKSGRSSHSNNQCKVDSLRVKIAGSSPAH